MRASRFAQPGHSNSPKTERNSRWAEKSAMESSPKRPLKPAKVKKSIGPSSLGIGSTPQPRNKRPSTPQPRNKRPSTSYAKSCMSHMHAENSGADVDTHAYVPPHPSDYEQEEFLSNFNNLPECLWPNWPDWAGGDHNDPGGSRLEKPFFSDSSRSSSSKSDSEYLWSTSSSSSSSSKFQERNQPRETSCAFWTDYWFWDRKPWKKLRHRKSSLTNIWDCKAEAKVEENFEPILVSVNVLGSPGPLRLVVDRNDSVLQTIDFALRRYAAQGRLPTLVGPSPRFGLYCRNPDFEALDDEALIGQQQSRHFHLYRKHTQLLEGVDNVPASCKSIRTITVAPFRTWIRDSLARMQSWTANLIQSLSQKLTFWMKGLKPLKFYRLMYIIAMSSLF